MASPFEPCAVVDLDLHVGIPVPSIQGLARYSQAQVLVRLDGVPVGYVRCPVANGCCDRAALTRSISSALEDQLVRRRLVATMTPAVEAPAGPTMTVVLCTRDRVDELEGCLASLSALDYPGMDVLVVDNAPGDDLTRRCVDRWPAVRYIREERPGLSRARNRGIASSTSDIIAFVDDDVRVDRRWAHRIGGVFATQPDVAAVLGLVAPLELETIAQQQFESHGGFGRGFERRWLRRARGATAAPALANTGTFGTGANMAFRRRVFDAVGAFDPALGAGTPSSGGEDLDMIFRVLSAGDTIVYEPGALVWHRHRRETEALRGQIASWGRGMFAYLTRTFEAAPAERSGLLRLAAGLLLVYYPRRVVQGFAGSGVDARLALAEFAGALGAPWRYRQARRTVADETDDVCVAAPRRPRPIAQAPLVVSLDLDGPFPTFVAVPEGADEIELQVSRGSSRLGVARVGAGGGPVDAARLRDAVVAQIDLRLLDPAGRMRADVRRWLAGGLDAAHSRSLAD